jgi:hypothetical protein
MPNKSAATGSKRKSIKRCCKLVTLSISLLLSQFLTNTHKYNIMPKYENAYILKSISKNLSRPSPASLVNEVTPKGTVVCFFSEFWIVQK